MPFGRVPFGRFQNSLSKEAIERKGRKEGMEGRREVAKAQKSGREQSARLKSARLFPLEGGSLEKFIPA